MSAWYVLAFATAVVLLIVAAVGVLDERKRERKRADRLAFKAFMAPRWGAAWNEVYPSVFQQIVEANDRAIAARRDAALTRVARDLGALDEAETLASTLDRLDAAGKAVQR